MARKSAWSVLISIVAVTISCVILVGFSYGKTRVTLYGEKAEAMVNGVNTPISAAPIIYKNKTYVPADDILKLCGFTLGWDTSSNSTVAIRDGKTNHIVYGTKEGILWVGNERLSFDTPPVIYNNTAFISLEMFAAMSDDSIYINGAPEKIKMGMRDLLEDTYINDNYRLIGESAAYKGITIVGNTGMELLTISDSSAQSYAQMVNAVSEALPNVEVYNIAVPTACEFYAPKELYTNQTAGIKKIYSLLNEKVTPINVVKTLMDHAAEFIYFRTDHHWTQRGAYYAYKEYADVKGFEIDPLSTFDVQNSFSHVGSFKSFTKGTAGEKIMLSNPDMLQIFMPKYTAVGAAYNDMYMRSKKWDLNLVYPNFNSYSAFIGGDNPLAVFRTSNANGKKLVIIKESYGTAFATWAVNNYEYIYVIDPRKFNGFGGQNERFNLKEFYEINKFDDLVIINYPGTIGSSSYKSSVLGMI